MARSSRYTARYLREDGWWIVRIVEARGVHSNGRTLNEARRRVREALSLVIGDDAFSISLAERVVLPAGARRELTRQKRPADAPKTRPGERWKPPELPLVR